MSDFYLGEIRLFAVPNGNFVPPRGWALCNGQLLPVQQNMALFPLLNITYGGDGRNTFGLPNLQGTMPLGYGKGASATYRLGQTGGEANHTLTPGEIPAHTHQVVGSPAAADQSSPANNYLATQAANAYAPTTNGALSPAAIGSTGSSQPHPNMPPYLTMVYCIAVQGVYPPRS
jgi:microcystin-dependent protein